MKLNEKENPNILNTSFKYEEIKIEVSEHKKSEFVKDGVLIDPMKWVTHSNEDIRIAFSFSIREVDNVPNEILEILFNYDNISIDAALSCSKSITLEMLTKIIERRIDNESFILLNVLNFKNTPLEILLKVLDFWQDKNSDNCIRSRIVKKLMLMGALTEEDLVMYSGDSDPIIRSYVAVNEKTPKDILEKLSDDCFDVRMFLSVNPALPENLIEKLSSDSHPDIKNSVKRKTLSDEQKELLECIDVGRNFPLPEDIDIALNPNTELQLLLKLVKHEDVEVRMAVAAHPKVTKEMLDDMSADSSSEVRRIVALNPVTSWGTLSKLSNENTYDMLSAIASHPHATPGILIEIKKKIEKNHSDKLMPSLKAIIDENLGRKLKDILN